MADALILHSDIVSRSDTTVSATNGSSTLPVANLGKLSPLVPFRTTATSTVIDITCSQSRTARGLVMSGLGQSLSAFTTATLAASTSALGGTDQLDADLLGSGQRYSFDPIWGVQNFDFESDVTARYWRLTLGAATAFDVGRLFIGQDLGLSITIGYPFSVSIEDSSITNTLMTGETEVNPVRLRRVFEMRLTKGATAADVFDLAQRTLAVSTGPARQVAFILNPNDAVLARQACIGRLSPGPGSLDGVNERGQKFTIREDGGTSALRS